MENPPADRKQSGILKAAVFQIYLDNYRPWFTPPTDYIHELVVSHAGKNYEFASSNSSGSGYANALLAHLRGNNSYQSDTAQEHIKCPAWFANVTPHEVAEIIDDLQWKGFLPGGRRAPLNAPEREPVMTRPVAPSAPVARKSSHRIDTLRIEQPSDEMQNLPTDYDGQELTSAELTHLERMARNAFTYLKDNELQITPKTLKNQIAIGLGNPGPGLPKWMTPAWLNRVPEDLFKTWHNQLSVKKTRSLPFSHSNARGQSWQLAPIEGREITRSELIVLGRAVDCVLDYYDNEKYNSWPSVKEVRSELPRFIGAPSGIQEWVRMIPGELIRDLMYPSGAIYRQPWKLNLPPTQSGASRKTIAEFGIGL
jgi:hypothetical protein